MEILLSALISCSDGKWILDGIASSEMTNSAKSDMVIDVIRSMPDNCRPSDYYGESTR